MKQKNYIITVGLQRNRDGNVLIAGYSKEKQATDLKWWPKNADVSLQFNVSERMQNIMNSKERNYKHWIDFFFEKKHRSTWPKLVYPVDSGLVKLMTEFLPSWKNGKEVKYFDAFGKLQQLRKSLKEETMSSKSIQKRLESHEQYHREEISNSSYENMLEDLTLREFRAAIKGKRLWVNVLNTEFAIRISQRDAIQLYNDANGNIIIFPWEGSVKKSEDLQLEPNAHS